MTRHVRRGRGWPGMRKRLSRLGLPGRVARPLAANGGRSLVQTALSLEVRSRLLRLLFRSRGASLPVVLRRQRLVALQKLPVHRQSASLGALVHNRIVHPEQLWTPRLVEGLLDPGLPVRLRGLILVVHLGLPCALRDAVHVVLLVLLQVGLPLGLRDLGLGGLRGLVLLVVLLAARREDDLLARPALGRERRGRRRGGRRGGGRRARPGDGREERRRRSEASWGLRRRRDEVDCRVEGEG